MFRHTVTSFCCIFPSHHLPPPFPLLRFQLPPPSSIAKPYSKFSRYRSEDKGSTMFFHKIPSREIVFRWDEINHIAVFALIRNFDRAEAMMIFTCIAWGLTIYYCLLKRFLGDIFYTKAYRPGKHIFDKLWSITPVRMWGVLLFI